MIDCCFNYGIVAGEFTRACDWIFDLALDLLNLVSGLAVHWFDCGKSLVSCARWVPIAVDPVLSSGTGRSLAGSDPVIGPDFVETQYVLEWLMCLSRRLITEKSSCAFHTTCSESGGSEEFQFWIAWGPWKDHQTPWACLGAFDQKIDWWFCLLLGAGFESYGLFLLWNYLVKIRSDSS